MDLSNVVLGLVTGLPVMAVVGPIALLLIEQGLERGLRGGWPAALGVAAADLSFASVAALAGVAAARYLEPVAGVLRVVAVGLLVVLAARLARAALAELRAATASSLVPAGAGSGGTSPIAPPARPLPLAGGFYGLTLLNPVTVMVFCTLVLSGGQGTGSIGWVLGMALASLMVNFGFVAVGHGLGTVLDARAVARLRLCAAALILVMAVHFATV